MYKPRLDSSSKNKRKEARREEEMQGGRVEREIKGKRKEEETMKYILGGQWEKLEY